MARESNTGLNVSQIYGARETGGAVGQLPSTGSTRELTLQLTGDVVENGFLDQVVIPAGAEVLGAKVYVKEAFSVSADIVVTFTGSETITIASADAVATGSADATLAGFTDPVATTTLTDSVASTVTDAEVGYATLVIEYVKVN